MTLEHIGPTSVRIVERAGRRLDPAFVKAEIAKLIAAYPDLAEDETLRADMVEAETDAIAIIERALSERGDAATMAEAIKAKETGLAARRGRFERKAEAMKLLIKSIMRAASLDTLTLPEATLSLAAGRSTVGIIDIDDLPQGYFKTTRQADKEAIRTAFAAGQDVPGAAMVIGETTLVVRTK